MKYLVTSDEPTPEDAVLKIDDMEGYTIIDPACGSGHILVEAFDLLYLMYQEEAYPAKAAITSILTKNIIGLDLDTRAKQLATFALLMKACQKDPSFLDCKIMPRILDMPEPFVYRGGTMQDFLQLFFHGGSRRTFEETNKALELLQQADNLGSIMKFDISDETRAAIKRCTEEWEAREYVNPDITAVIPSMKVILTLTDKYTTTVMNPPYMGAGNMNPSLKSYLDVHYSAGKYDLMTVFMMVASNIVVKNGYWAMINLPSWMFIPSFSDFRKELLENESLLSLLHLGRGIFGPDFGSVCFVFQNSQLFRKGYYRRLFEEHVQVRSVERIQQLFFTPSYGHYTARQEDFLLLPGHVIGYWVSQSVLESFSHERISAYATAVKGLDTCDNQRFVRLWPEVDFRKVGLSISSTDDTFNHKWFPYCKGGGFKKWYGLYDYLVNWENDGEVLRNLRDENGRIKSRPQNTRFYFKEGITWCSVTSSRPSFRYMNNSIFGGGGSALFSSKDLKLIAGFMNSKIAKHYLQIINPTINFLVGDMLSLPVLFSSNNIDVGIINSCIDITKTDWDAHETSWDFKKNELIHAQRLCRQNVADMDMLSEKEIMNLKKSIPFDDHKIEHCLKAYKTNWEKYFKQLHSNEEELNRQFIEIYGLQDELTPDVPLEEITILQEDEMSIVNNRLIWNDDIIIKQLISYAIGCWMGRYRLDREGLYIAHYPTDEEVCVYDYNGYRFEIDDDAIIPLMGRDTPFEDDNALQKLNNFVKIVFGEDNLTENLNTIDHALGKSLEEYLVKDFWNGHKKMYQNRPIYWLFSSKKGAFQVLVYMHRMNPYTVEKIRTKYLLPYIEYLKGKIDEDEARSADLTTAERKNLAKIRAALDECTEYHDRLHDVAIKAIDFNLDDGVIANYAKFGNVLAKIK